METPGDIQTRLAGLKEDEEGLLHTLERVRGLLSKADVRKREDPQDVRRWNRTVDNLEQSLLQTKARLEACRHEIAVCSARLVGGVMEDASLGKGPAAEDASATIIQGESLSPVEVTPEQIEQAAHRVLATPDAEADRIPLQDVAMAKAVLDHDSIDRFDGVMRRDLSKRVAMYVRATQFGDPASRRPMTEKGRRYQALLRHVIDKCASGQTGALTLSEVDLVANCCELAYQHGASDPKGERLREILRRAILDINARCANLNELHARLTARGQV